MNDNLTTEVLGIYPFFVGHRAVIDMGWVKLDELKETLSKANPISMEYLDSSEIKITDYFDVIQNKWSNERLNIALDKAVKICRNL